MKCEHKKFSGSLSVNLKVILLVYLSTFVSSLVFQKNHGLELMLLNIASLEEKIDEVMKDHALMELNSADHGHSNRADVPTTEQLDKILSTKGGPHVYKG